MNRQAFLARIRTAVDTANGTIHRQPDAVTERIAHPPKHPLPACAKIPPADYEAQFVRMLEARGTLVRSCPDLANLPAAVEPLLDDKTGPLILGDDPRFSDLSWKRETQLWNPTERPDDGTAALTHALSAVAETGTLVFASGSASPATLAFLPETHVVALARNTIVGSFEEAFSGLTSRFPKRLPRAVNLVSGPSRTSDIGGYLVKGAHGPRRLVVVVYGPQRLSCPS